MVILRLEMFVILDVIRASNTLEMEIRLHALPMVGQQLGLAKKVTLFLFNVTYNFTKVF